ncbi:TPR-like protein [Trametes sanguinea]|nr:TPR-like protein [Trametes sanguinea]
MQRDAISAVLSPQLCQRYASLIWSCLDAKLHKSALFYAERYFVLDLSNHDARHLYATALLESGQPHSAHRLVHVPAKETRCTGCVNILAKCCMALGRHRQAREALEGCLRDHSYTPTQSMGYRTATAFPDEAILCCQAGNSALKGNLHESAAMSYRQALALNPMLWEAFEGLCAIGDIPFIENLFPPRTPPVRRRPGEEGPSSKSMPIATGAGFFTPDAGSAGNLFRDWKPGFRGMDAPAGPRDSMSVFTCRSSRPPHHRALTSNVAGKTAPAPPVTRRSTRLQSGTGSRRASKTSTRDRRRAATKPRSTSTSQSHDSGLEEEPGGMESAFAPTSPIGHSDTSPHPPNLSTAEQERAAEEANTKLSFLAQELLSTDPKSPQAWIAVGNCFSLEKEKAQALTCFRRAAQLDPTCAYAYTLSGHESIDEDLNKAISFFQSALRADARHYNAWYGLGTCYMRMSKLRLADYHFRKASSIHPQNAVLLGCVGMVQERYQNYDEALKLFNQAIQFSPENALVRYHRAKILIATKRYTVSVGFAPSAPLGRLVLILMHVVALCAVFELTLGIWISN